MTGIPTPNIRPRVFMLRELDFPGGIRMILSVGGGGVGSAKKKREHKQWRDIVVI